MLNIQTILAPIDFSERSAAALEHAGALAELLQANLIAAHFLPPAPADYAVLYPVLTDDARTLADLERRLGEFVSKTLGAFPAECIARSGDPSRGIVELVSERSIELVVIATHGRGPFRRMLLGSVASKLLHDLSVPILTGAHMAELEPWDRRPYQRIVCAVELDEHSRRALEFARDLGQVCGARLDVVHAAPSLELSGALGGEDWFPPNLRSQVVADHTDRVKHLVSEAGCNADIHVEASDAVPFILNQIEQLKADLLVVGKASQTGFFGRHRHLVHDLICRAEIPVLSV